MNSFPLKIVTPDGLQFDGLAEQLTVRTTTGDIGILAGHINCVAPLGMGCATITVNGKKKYAACIGGLLTVIDNVANLVPTTFEWAEQIDVVRAERSADRAKQILSAKDSSSIDIKLAEARLKRALVRKSVADQAPTR